MQIGRKKIESGLLSKGFVRGEETHHNYFYHIYSGKRTGAYTYTSHGSRYKTYGISLIKMMKTQLKLDNNKEVFNLCTCPMDGDEYNQKLIDKGVFPP
jgi:hypothetical protein